MQWLSINTHYLTTNADGFCCLFFFYFTKCECVYFYWLKTSPLDGAATRGSWLHGFLLDAVTQNKIVYTFQHTHALFQNSPRILILAEKNPELKMNVTMESLPLSVSILKSLPFNLMSTNQARAPAEQSQSRRTGPRQEQETVESLLISCHFSSKQHFHLGNTEMLYERQWASG